MRSAFTALLLGFLVMFYGEAEAHHTSKRTYTEAEYKCVAKALWHEGGSTMGLALQLNKDGARLELRLMAYSMVLRALNDHWYYRRDWGGPDLCAVIRHRIGRVCQYSFVCTNAVNQEPAEVKTRWQTVLEQLKEPIIVIIGKTKEKYEQWISDREKWEEVKSAARDALHFFDTNGSQTHPWEPPAEYKDATTYQHYCSEPRYYEDSCDQRLVSNDRSKCYFALSQVALDTGELPQRRKHVFYRELSLDEIRTRVEGEPPEICTKGEAPRTLEIMRTSWRERLKWEEEKLLNPDLQSPEFKKPEPEKWKRKRIKKNGKNRKESRG